MELTRRVVVVVAMIAGLAVPWAFSQDQEVGQEDAESEVIGGLAFTERIEVTVVGVDVFVYDKKGNPVTDLDREDFRIFQDGEEHAITNFAHFDEELISEQVRAEQIEEALPGPTPIETEHTTRTPVRPKIKPIWIVLFVDSENLRPFDRNRVLTQIRGFLGDIMYPHVQVMVVSYQRSLKIVTPFTTDKTRVMDSLRSLYKVATGRPEQDNARNKIIRELARLKDKGPQKGSQPSNDLMMIQGDIQGFADASANDLEFAINAIREIATSLSGFEGRKWLVHISNGLAMVPGRDLFHDFSQVYQSASTLNFMMRYDMKSWYDTLASAANAQGVSFLTIDASGLGGSSRVSAEHIRPVDPITDTIHLNNHQETLQYLAERTGGRTILSANDVTPGLQAFRKDLFSYYSLGYTISASGSDRVHRIKVELVDQPGYDLNYRRNFIEKSLESRVQDAVITGLMYDMDQNPMKIDSVTFAPRPAADDRWMVPLEVSVPLESIALVPHRDEYVGQIVFFVAARDQKGRQSDLQRREQEVRVPAAEYEDRRGDWVTLTLDMLMEEGTYRVAIGVLDRITRQSAYMTLSRQVPGSL